MWGCEVWAVGHGLFGPGCPWEGPAVTTGELGCKGSAGGAGFSKVFKGFPGIFWCVSTGFPRFSQGFLMRDFLANPLSGVGCSGFGWRFFKADFTNHL